MEMMNLPVTQYPEWESNPHALRHWNLRPARLPLRHPGNKSERPGTIRRPPAWEAGALPTELRSHLPALRQRRHDREEHRVLHLLLHRQVLERD